MVDTDEKLQKFLPELRKAAWVSVDTEADSLHAYPEKVCLIQISTASGDRLVDPLAGINLGALLESLGGRELIMHGADYDLRLLLKHHQFVPSAVFDTMLAARLLGERQFGLGDLVQKYLDVRLEKGPQKANWALRPLTERMEKYARNDTHYLKPLENRLKPDLQAKGRLSWHQESCARLVAECSKPRLPDEDQVWRVKGSHLLGRPGLAILHELWHWREEEAKTANRPPFFVLSHEAMVTLSGAAATGRDLESLLPKFLSERRRAGLIAAVERGLSLPAAQHPKIPQRSGRRPTEAERVAFLDLQKRRDACAAELGIDPTLIASKAELSDLSRNREKHVGDLMNWQRGLLGLG